LFCIAKDSDVDRPQSVSPRGPPSPLDIHSPLDKSELKRITSDYRGILLWWSKVLWMNEHIFQSLLCLLLMWPLYYGFFQHLRPHCALVTDQETYAAFSAIFREQNVWLGVACSEPIC
jgi:hypothetical protein